AAFYKNAPVLDSGARGATTTFVEREIGDVLVGWETDARLAVDKLGKDKVEIVYPSESILAETPVAVVDEVVDRRATRHLATAYVQSPYSPEPQQTAAQLPFRPRDAAAATPGPFAAVKTFTIDDKFGGWQKAQAVHFGEDGVFDQITTADR